MWKIVYFRQRKCWEARLVLVAQLLVPRQLENGNFMKNSKIRSTSSWMEITNIPQSSSVQIAMKEASYIKVIQDQFRYWLKITSCFPLSYPWWIPKSIKPHRQHWLLVWSIHGWFDKLHGHCAKQCCPRFSRGWVFLWLADWKPRGHDTWPSWCKPKET